MTPAYLALTYDHPELVWLPGASYNIGYSVYPVSFPSGVTSTKENIELAGSTFTLKPNSQNGTLTAANVNSLFNQTKTQIDQMLSAEASSSLHSRHTQFLLFHHHLHQYKDCMESDNTHFRDL